MIAQSNVCFREVLRPTEVADHCGAWVIGKKAQNVGAFDGRAPEATGICVFLYLKDTAANVD